MLSDSNLLGNVYFQSETINFTDNRISNIVFQDDIFCLGTETNCSANNNQQDVIIMNFNDNWRNKNWKDTISLSGKSISDYNNFNGTTKDLVEIVLGKNDTLILSDIWATSDTTNFKFNLSTGIQTLDITNLEVTPWYRTGEFLTLEDLAVINVQNLQSQDKVIVNPEKSKLRFSQKFSDVTVDIIEKFGFFDNPNDYLGRLNFQNSKLSTVLKSFNLTSNVSLKGDVSAVIWENKSTSERQCQFDQEIIVSLQDDFSLRDYLDGENDQVLFNGFDNIKFGVYFGESTIKSINDKDPLTGMSQKDFFRFNLKNDTLFANHMWANNETTNFNVNLFKKGTSTETLNLVNLDITPWYLTGKHLSKNDILLINVRNLSKEDKIFFDSKSQDIQFYQKGSSTFVDIIEEGGKFQSPEDYLGRLQFLNTSIMTVQSAFQSI